MRNRSLPAVLLAVLILSPLAATASPQASPADVARITEIGRADSRVTDHLDHLVNTIGPRLTSSDALTEACRWTRDQFAGWGLEAWLEPWGTFPVGFNRGPSSARLILPEERDIAFSASSWSAGTDGPTKGRVVEGLSSATDASNARKKDFRGAWVLNPQKPAKRSDRAAIASVYDEAGILGTISVARGELLITSGGHRISMDDLPTRPAFRITATDGAAIRTWLEEDEKVELEIDAPHSFKEGPIELFNVIADIKGTEFPDEYVIVGGHIDSWDGATGTIDNGTGCATTLEAARMLMTIGAKPRRTIRFMLWSGEEQGLLGSRAWIKQNPEALEKISAVVVHDGGTNYLSGIHATEAMEPMFKEVFEPVMALAPSEYPFEIRSVGGLPRGVGSDHDSFLGAGVPGFFWRQAGRSDYNHGHHTQNDTFDMAIPEYQRHSALVVAIGALGLANTDSMVSREGMTGSGGRGSSARGPRRRLGVDLDGLAISEIFKDTVAAKAGLKVGDVILKIDGKDIEGRIDLIRALRDGGPKKKIVVKRGEETLGVDCVWEEEEKKEEG